MNEVYEVGFRHALNNIEKNGGSVQGDDVHILTQKPQPVRFEKSFEGMYPVEKQAVAMTSENEISFSFEGTGFILSGVARPKNNTFPDYEFQTEVYLDGKKVETPKLPTNFTTRRLEVSWKYPIAKGKHTVYVKILNPDKKYEIRNTEYIIFSDQPIHDPLKNTIANEDQARYP